MKEKGQPTEFEILRQKVLSGKSTLEETERYQREVDLKDLASTGTYLKESKHTREWSCPDCGGPIPCAIDCPQCGHPRPEENFDIEQEGIQGHHRKVAGFRNIGEQTETLVDPDELDEE